MIKIPFYKYQGTGNDFVIIDNREGNYLSKSNKKEIAAMCDRKFGIGADGLILLQEHGEYDFEMVYFNADGRESSMCGNGGRCTVAFARSLGIVEDHCRFLAIDGEHEAVVRDNGWVELKMNDVEKVEVGEDYFILDTGSPHYVIFVEDLDDIDVVENGQAIRYSDRFKNEGINVNFVEKKADGLLVATYERGVENETLSCGTGVTAAAISYQLKHTGNGTVHVSTKGGQLQVRVEKVAGATFRNIWLCGPAESVFNGTYFAKNL